MASGGLKDTNKLLDETANVLCTLCKTKDKNTITKATKFCVDCKDYYCSSCVKFHEDIPALTRHKILEKGQWKEPPVTSAGQCERHCHKLVDMYCKNHDYVGCSTCMTDHKSCRDTFYISDFIRNNRNSPNLKAIDKELGTTADLLTDQNRQLQERREGLLRYEARCLEKLQEFRDEINQRLDKLEENSVEDIQAKYKPELDKIQQHIGRIKKMTTAVLLAKNDIATGSTSKNETQLFVSSKRSKSISEDAVRYIAEVKADGNREITFTKDSELFVLLNQLNVLGKLTDTAVTKNKNASSTKSGKK